MYINRVSSVSGVSVMNAEKKKECDNSISDNKNITRLSGYEKSFVNFNGNSRILKVEKADLKKEKAKSRVMRKIGVATPYINPDGTYRIRGNEADISQNPITSSRIRNVLKNLFIMDKNGIMHGDIEQGHVFYSKDNSVEFDCCRFGYAVFDDSQKGRIQWEFADFDYPTNIRQFENNCIGKYIDKADEQTKQKVIGTYLQEVSGFHAQRVDMLKKKNATDEQVLYAQLQSNVFKYPTKKLIDLYKDKITINYQNRLAFTEEDEGHGACGHEKDENRITKAVCMYFDITESCVDYIEKIRQAIKTEDDEITREYLGFEERYAQKLLNNAQNSNIGRALWTLNPDNNDNIAHRYVPESSKQAFAKQYELMKSEDNSEKKKELISKLKEDYIEMLSM